MFKNRKEMALFRKISKKCGCNWENPSFADKLVYSIIPFGLVIQKKTDIFRSKYVLTDCALACVSYTLHAIYEKDEEMKLLDILQRESFIPKMLLAIHHLYDLDPDELDKLYKNRMESITKLEFDPITQNLKNFVEEVGYLVAHDLHYNKYVEFNSQSALIINGFSKQMQIEMAINNYFKIMVPMITELIIKT